MSRIGTCLQCGQRYGDIPDSLTATRVKCKTCGGVVEIPPLAAATPPPMAAPPAPVAPAAPAMQVTPAPIAMRKPPTAAVPTQPIFAPKAPAAPVRPVVPPKPLAAPVQPVAPLKPAIAPAAPKSAPAAPVKPIVAPRPAAAAPVQPAIARAVPPPAAPKPDAAAILAAARAKREALASPPAEKKPSAAEILAAAKAKRDAAAAPAPAPARPVAARSAPVRPSSARRAKDDDDEDDGRRARGYARPKSNKGPMILVAVLVVASAGAGGLWWMVQQKAQKEAAAKEASAPGVVGAQPARPKAAVPDPDMTGSSSTPPSAPSNAPSAAGGGAPPAAVEPTPAAAQPEPAAPSQPAAPAVDGEFVFVVPEPGQPIEEVRGLVDPVRIRLDQVPPLAKWHGSSDEQWKEVTDDLALYLENSGARSNRAGDRLIAAGRHAFPAIVNAMMTQDYTTVDGVKMAGSLNDLLGKIGKGTNQGWRSAERHPIGSAEWTDAVLFQKKVTIRWQRQWVNLYRDKDDQWEGFVKKVTSKKEETGDGVPPPPQPF
jgi:hypothetical protein